VTHVYALDYPHQASLPEIEALVGGKAANLGVMARELRLPVPPGFVISTEACNVYLAGGWPPTLDAEMRAQMAVVEAIVGRRFGDPSDPLLVSVRSGAPISMPGMMDTILNLGLTEATTAGLAGASRNERFARDCRDRFRATFQSIVSADPVPEDPWVQLRLAVEAVFRSWNSARACAYRRHEGIAEDLGTAVTVQTMVFGNRGATSATGVLFTRNPATGEPSLYGDVMFNAQGEDVVAGTHQTESLSVLGERLPEIATELREHAGRLERHYADMCDIEFTIDQEKLWLLQVRIGKRSPQAALRIALDMAVDQTFPLTRKGAVERVAHLLVSPPMAATRRSGDLVPLVTGLPASPGLATGEIATSPEAAVRLADDGRRTILVRTETSPDDVQGIAQAAGILTSRGGLASHAAVLARGWGIPAVVGAALLEVRDGEVILGDRVLHSGDVITIDGTTGDVFDGAIARTLEMVPEAKRLLAWASELGIPIGEAIPERATLDLPSASMKAIPDDCLRAIAIKGFAPVQAIADAVLSTTEQVQPLLDQLVAEGLVRAVAGTYRLADDGKSRSEALLAAEQAEWGLAEANHALDAFQALDHRMKDTVTAWQLRGPQGAPLINDHTDGAYDAEVLDRLAALHDDAAAWLSRVESGCPRLFRYRARLARAVELAVAGDQRFVASPRVDSYHAIWFELHEDLIRLVGRTRAEEVAAGRA
jgi:pyruvate,orthophosphate dikinase